MNEVQIPLKLTGIGAIKKELRDLKGQIADSTDPEQMQKLAQRAGELADQLKDANEQVAIFNTGSKFEAATNAFGMIKNDLMSLDFEGAADKAKIFQSAMAGIGGKDISGALKGLISTVATLGKTFISFGASLLMNPIFLLVGVVTAIVTAVVLFLNKIGFLQDAFDALMIPVNKVVQGFKDLTDWMGLTDHAGEEAAANEKKRQEEIAAMKQKQVDELMAQIELNKQLELSIENRQKAEIGLLESQGKSAQNLKTLMAEQQLEEAKMSKNRLENLIKGSKGWFKNAEAALIDYDTKIIESQTALNNVVKDGVEKYKEYQQARLDATRLIRDLEISLIKDTTERELTENEVKYQRLIYDTQKNEKLKADEKKKIIALYEQIQLEEDKKIQDKAKEQLRKSLEEQVALINEVSKSRSNKQKDESEKELQRRTDAISLVDSLNRTQAQNDLLALQNELQQRLDLVKGNAEQEAAVRTEYAKKVRLMEIAEAEKRREAILNLATTTNEGLNQLGQLFINDQKKLEQFQKATALVQIGIDTAKAISSLVAAAQANPFNGVSAGAAGIAQFATGIVQILTNMAKAKQLLTNPTSSPNAGGGGVSGGGSATATAQATPAISLFGQANQLNQVGAPTSVEANQNITVQAVVSETDVTSTQTKIDKIKKNAEL